MTDFSELLNPHPTPKPRPLSVVRLDAHDESAFKYAKGALRNQIKNVALAPEGQRNHTLNVAAWELKPFINIGLLDEHDVTDELTGAARSCGLTESEITATIRSGFLGADTNNASVDIPPPRVPGPYPTGEIVAASLSEPVNDIWGDFRPTKGGEWLFDNDDIPTVIWGEDNDILWAEGEALMIAGVMGLGKTTLAGRLLRAQLGLDSEVLGLPVLPATKPILYLAMDRPRQIRRSMRRQFSERDRDKLKNLVVRQGPPVADIATNPLLLTRMAQEVGAGTVYLDSLKDAVVGLTADETAASYNRARQHLLARDINLVELHHMVKRNTTGGIPSGIADVYGSGWLTAGAGSVITLTGHPGDLVIKFKLAKMPADEVGPFNIQYDPDAGQFSVVRLDFVEEVERFGANGATAKDIAKLMYEDEFRPTDAQCKRAARQLDKYVKLGALIRMDGTRGGYGGSTPVTWYLSDQTMQNRLKPLEMF